ncbi:twin-arginine translocase subunit TatC [Lysobacter pythonis]|uniref:Sec-independent protein translocase protein TatC n=1 Tax=Solilutibacter pythonis TaxID=2483112 RepID=A0A3M2HL60_9GAMM|nr:twin-arginine translocase subunit TatC [Lysobacter pythonis]RMH88109.1 twin-arginine translocase subunit TatC [Lysobacter pythonis]
MNDASATAGWLSHLVELRARLVKVAVTVIVLFAALAVFSGELYTLLAEPMVAALPAGSQMIATDPLTPFSTPLRLALYLALLLAAPVLLYQGWAFVAPGLYRHEKRLAAPLLASSMLLFYAGCAFAYFVLLPAMFKFLAMARPESVTMMPDIARYLDFVAVIALASGFSFEVPVAITILVLLGWVTPTQLRTARGYALIAIAVIAMIITPGDGVSMILMMIPMYLLYEAGILAAAAVAPKPATPPDAPTDSAR